MPQLANPDEEQKAQALYESLKKNLQHGTSATGDGARAAQLKQSGIATIARAYREFKKAHGTLAAGYEELIQRVITPPSVPWHRVFAAWLQASLRATAERGMSRVSKRRAALQAYAKKNPQYAFLQRLPLFPGTTRRRMYHVVTIVDTSGSMSTALLQRAVSELHGLHQSGVPLTITVLHVDCAVAKRYTLGPDDKIDLRHAGRGGTSFDIGLSYVARMISEERVPVDAVVYITDGECDRPRTKLPCPVAWLLTPDAPAIMRGVPGNITLHMREEA